MSGSWKMGVGAVFVLFAVVLLTRACTPDQSPVLNDTRWRDSLRLRELAWEQDSTARAAQIHETEARADSLRRVAVAGEGRYRRLARWADSLSRIGAGNFNSDSGMQGSFDSVVPRAAYDSLWSAYETADSTVQVLHGAINEYIHAASLYASQAVAAEGRLSQDRATYEGRIADLTAALRKQTRGCRVVGLIPCPQLSVGYGAMLTGGQVRVGPAVTVSFPLKF